MSALGRALQRLAQLRGERIDGVALGELMRRNPCVGSPLHSEENWQSFLWVLREIGYLPPVLVQDHENHALPLLAYSDSLGWAIISARSATGEWVVESFGDSGLKRTKLQELVGFLVIGLSKVVVKKSVNPGSALREVKAALLKHRGAILDAVMATAVLNLLALMTSMYTMQVYDRVLPTKGEHTLYVLTVGVILAIVFDVIFKSARTKLMETVAQGFDADLSRIVFERLLGIRLDQMPRTVGTLSSQLRGYETIRSFVSATTVYFLIDVPFGVIFLLFIWLIGGPVLASVPAVFLIFAVTSGLLIKRRMESAASEGAAATNRKVGLLVEAVEGAEVIKASGGGWRFLSRWAANTSQSLMHDGEVRALNEKVLHVAQLCQQVGYVSVIAVGSMLAMKGEISMGGLIACGIISGRSLAPVVMLPGVLMQWAHAKAAMKGLESIWALETDNQDHRRVLVPDVVRGEYQLEDIQFSYPGTRVVLRVPKLRMQPGERIGVIGPVGAGKSSLLRILAGLYRPQQGRVSLDGMDIEQISRTVISENVGYLQQETKLFYGTLRENLILGIPDPGDSAILQAAANTGLAEIISSHPKGLGLEISEGGAGLSGGQRQIIGLTRLLLANPKVWLMDEPTASMDEELESRCIRSIKSSLGADQLMVLVTHKPSMLMHVDRLIVINHNTVAVDGPTEAVLKYLQQSNGLRSDLPRASGSIKAVGA